MSKLDRVKRLLIRDGVIVCLVAALAGGVLWFANARHAEAQRQSNTLKTQITGANQKVQQFESEFQKAAKFAEQYRRFSGDGFSREDLDRKAAIDAVERLKDRFYLSDVSIESKPYQPLTEAPWAGRTVRLGAVPITIRLKAFSDEYLFAFIFALDRELQGFTRINRLLVTRLQTVRDVPLKQVGEGHLPALVSAELEFLWLGFEKISEGGGAGNP